MIKNQAIVSFLLRLSIASVFLYASIAATLYPDNWISFLPPVLTNLFPARDLLLGFSAVQVIVSLWLLSGKKTFYAAILSSLLLAGIILANLDVFDIVFRDLAILCASLALVVANFPKEYGGKIS